MNFAARVAVGTAGLVVGFTATTFGAETSAAAQAEVAGPGLQFIDGIIVAVYAVSTLLLGWYYGRKQSSTKEYFVGSGSMNPLLIGVSLFATLLSTISYRSMPGEALGKGPVYMTSMLALPAVYLFVGYVLLPVYMRQRVTSAYELLEQRLGIGIRILGATLFILLRLVWMSLLVYVTAEAMVIMMGLSEKDIPMVAIVTGLVAVVYTSLGGLRAVVVTDLMQTILLYGGALLVIGVVSWDLGGFGWFPTEWQDTWDTQPLVDFDPQTRVTVLGSLLTFFVWYVATSGGDQVSVQRFMATRDARAARRALAIQLTVSVVVGVTLGIVGFALLGYFQANPGLLPAEIDLKADADDIFPRFIAFHLPAGISGLVIAGMFAAAMSSVDSGVNSITAVVMTDFLERFGRLPRTPQKHFRVARVLALVIGSVVVYGSSFIGDVPGNITGVTQKTSNLLTTPIFGLFCYALFVPFARPLGVMIGTVMGTLTAAVIAFSGPLVIWLSDLGVDPSNFNVEIQQVTNPATGLLERTVQDPVSFQWIAPMAMLVNLVTGTLICYLQSRGGTVDEAANENVDR